VEIDAVNEPEGRAAPEATGVRPVDDALAELSQLDQLPTSEHVAVYEVVHRQLQDALADLDGS
jgi:fumarate hydratase class II